MSVEPPRCVNCREPLDIHRLEKEKPSIVIHKDAHITPPVGNRLNIQMFTAMKCQSCNKENHFLWNMGRVLSTEGVREQEKRWREEGDP